MPQLVKIHACVELVKSQVFFFNNNNVIFTLSPTTSVLVYLSAKTLSSACMFDSYKGSASILFTL